VITVVITRVRLKSFRAKRKESPPSPPDVATKAAVLRSGVVAAARHSRRFVASLRHQTGGCRLSKCCGSASVRPAGPTLRPTFEDAERVILLADAEDSTSIGCKMHE
jgi:hypothetical protein